MKGGGWKGRGEREARPAGGTREQPWYRYKCVMVSNELNKNEKEGRGEEKRERERERYRYDSLCRATYRLCYYMIL